VELWEWQNEEAIRRCNPESFAGHDFEVFGYEVDEQERRVAFPDVGLPATGSQLNSDCELIPPDPTDTLV
jgi:hypothetical protein